ncbi:hypothetical protein Trydic_g11405 [Trypoxylus dichotomus]
MDEMPLTLYALLKQIVYPKGTKSTVNEKFTTLYVCLVAWTEENYHPFNLQEKNITEILNQDLVVKFKWDLEFKKTCFRSEFYSGTEQYRNDLGNNAIPSGLRLLGLNLVLQPDHDPKHASKLFARRRSRRIQQSFGVLFPKPRSKLHKVIVEGISSENPESSTNIGG